MNKRSDVVTLQWYNDPKIITNIIMGLILVIIILSQSFAIKQGLNTNDIFRDLLNHNSIYLIVFVYFVSLRTTFGKKYFNYFNVFLMLLYGIISFTSLLTVFQSFSLISLVSLAVNVVLIVYMFHVLLRNTRVWKDYKLVNSPFNEIENNSYFYAIVILSIVLLTVNLIETPTVYGVFLSIFDCLYYVLISRYIYLYREYLDSKNNKNSEVRK